MASKVAGSMATPSCEAKRQARRMRSASSEKARRRVSHAAQDAALHVGHAAEGIDDPARRVVSQGVYGEVAPFQIFLNGGGLGHGVRVAPIAVGAVGAVGGDLQRLAVAHYRERAMATPVSTVPQPASRKASCTAARAGSSRYPHRG